MIKNSSLFCLVFYFKESNLPGYSGKYCILNVRIATRIHQWCEETRTLPEADFCVSCVIRWLPWVTCKTIKQLSPPFLGATKMPCTTAVTTVTICAEFINLLQTHGFHALSGWVLRRLRTYGWKGMKCCLSSSSTFPFIISVTSITGDKRRTLF